MLSGVYWIPGRSMTHEILRNWSVFDDIRGVESSLINVSRILVTGGVRSRMSSFPIPSFCLPTLDLSSLGAAGDFGSNWDKLGIQLEHFLTTDGYVYLTNHGIPNEMITAAFQKTKSFFELPTEVKLKYLKSPSAVTYHGYNAKFAKDVTRSKEVMIREYFHVWSNPSNVNCNYPDEIPGFRDSIHQLLYSDPAQNLNQVLLQLLSRIIQNGNEQRLEPGVSLASWHQGTTHNSTIKNYSYFSSMFYPKLPEEGVEDIGSSRCSAHTDCSTYTLLLLDQVEGLEKKDLEGQWTDIPTMANGILFIPGDFLEAISGGKLPALVHRVPTTLKNREERQSLPVYILPDNGIKFVPVDSTEPVTFGDYYENLIKDRYFRN